MSELTLEFGDIAFVALSLGEEFILEVFMLSLVKGHFILEDEHLLVNILIVWWRDFFCFRLLFRLRMLIRFY